MNSLNRSVWRCRYLCRRTKIRLFRALVLHVLLYGSETWSIGVRERGRLNSFSTRALHRIMGYRWDNFVSNDRLLRETGIAHQVTCMIRQCQLRLFGNVVRYPESDPVSRVISKEIGPALVLVSEYRWPLPGAGTTRKIVRMTLLSQGPMGRRRTVTAAARHLGVYSH